MKEVFSAFGSEVFRPMMTLFAPGALCISSWFVVWMRHSPEIYAAVARNRAEVAFLLVLTSFIAGLVIENFGSFIEAEIFDRLLLRRSGYEKHSSEWYEYLRQAFRVEPVGHRYMRTLVLHMKFELAMGLAAPVFALGLFFVEIEIHSAWIVFVVLCGFSAYLIAFEARRSHAALSELRRELLKGIKVVG